MGCGRCVTTRPCSGGELPPKHRLLFDPGDLPLHRAQPYRVTLVGKGRPTSAPITLPPLTFDVERDGEPRLAARGERPGWPYPLVVLENGMEAAIAYDGRSPGGAPGGGPFQLATESLFRVPSTPARSSG